MLKFTWLTILLALSYHASEQDASYLVISLSKTQCFGQCPAFEFEVYSDLTAKYKGTAHVDLIGEWTTKLSSEQYHNLIQEFEQRNFFGFSDRYYQAVTDLPTTYISYSDGEKEKKIMDYYGAPEELKKLETKVEEFITHLKWEKITN